MKNYVLITLLFFATSTFFAQKNVDTKSMIGIGCWSSGEQSETVQKFSKLLAKHKYQRIVEFLNSKNTAEKALATFVCGKLNGLGKITLSTDNLKQIQNIKKSEELVSVCSGCTYFDKIATKNLFLKDDGTLPYEGFLLEDYGNFWFENYIKK